MGTGDTVSGELRLGGLGGPRARPGWREHFEREAGDQAGLPVREGQGPADLHQLRGHSRPGQTGQDEQGAQVTAGSPAATTPTAIHSGEGSAGALAPAPEPRGQEDETEGHSVRGDPRQDVTRTGRRPRARAPGTFPQRGGCGAPACGHAVPTWHCGPAAGAGTGHRALWPSPARLWDWQGRQFNPRGVKDTGETRLGEAGRAA